MTALYVPSLLSDLGGTITTASVSNFAEAVDDRVAALLVAGTGVTLTYDDAANTITVTASGGGGGVTSHAALTGLTADDHAQYALLAGRTGGQTITGGTGPGNALALASTSHATKGEIQLGASGSRIKADGSLVVQSAVASAVNGFQVFDSVADAIQFQVGRGSGQNMTFQYYVPDAQVGIHNAGGPMEIRSTSLRWQRGLGVENCFELDASGDLNLSKNSSTSSRPVAAFLRDWVDATDATRTARLITKLNDSAAAREVKREWADGAAGRIATSAPASAPVDAHLANGQVSFYLDESGNNLKVRVRYSTGTLKTGTLALN